MLAQNVQIFRNHDILASLIVGILVQVFFTELAFLRNDLGRLNLAISFEFHRTKVLVAQSLFIHQAFLFEFGSVLSHCRLLPDFGVLLYR